MTKSDARLVVRQGGFEPPLWIYCDCSRPVMMLWTAPPPAR